MKEFFDAAPKVIGCRRNRGSTERRSCRSPERPVSSLALTAAAVHRSAASLGAMLTPGDIAIEKDLSGPLVNRLPSDADHGIIPDSPRWL